MIDVILEINSLSVPCEQLFVHVTTLVARLLFTKMEMYSFAFLLKFTWED